MTGSSTAWVERTTTFATVTPATSVVDRTPCRGVWLAGIPGGFPSVVGSCEGAPQATSAAARRTAGRRTGDLVRWGERSRSGGRAGDAEPTDGSLIPSARPPAHQPTVD